MRPLGATVWRSMPLLVTALSFAACVPESALGGGSFCALPAVPAPFPSDPPPPPGASREERVAALLGVRALLAGGAHDEASGSISSPGSKRRG